MENWYVIYCKPQQDARAEMELRNQKYEVFRPLVRFRRRYGARLRYVTESMFPRYLFIKLDDTVNWAPVGSTRGVAGLVRWGSYVPRVPTFVVEELFKRVNAHNCVDLSVHDYKHHEPVRITKGPFAGYQGLFDGSSGEERVIVLLEVMQQAQRLVLSEYSIDRV